MKNLLFLFLILPIGTLSQDIMIMKNGEEIKIKTLEILPDIIKFKKWDNLDGPIRSEYKSNVFMIKYQNGTKEVMSAVSNSQPSSQSNTEDSQKSQAIDRLKSYFIKKIEASPKLVYKDFRKTNGTMKNIFGQSVYEVEFSLRILFASGGWVIGDFINGYFNQSFKVHEEEQKIGFSSNSKYFESGTELELIGTSTMENSDNGYRVSEYVVKKINNLGVKSAALQQTTPQQPVTERKTMSEPRWLDPKPNERSNLSSNHTEMLTLIDEKYYFRESINPSTTIDSFYGKFYSSECKKGYIEFTEFDKLILKVKTNKRSCINILGNDKLTYDYHNGILFYENGGYNFANTKKFNVNFIYMNRLGEIIFNECATLDNGDIKNTIRKYTKK